MPRITSPAKPRTASHTGRGRGPKASTDTYQRPGLYDAKGQLLTSYRLLTKDISTVGKAIDACPEGVDPAAKLKGELGRMRTDDGRIVPIRMHSPIVADKSRGAWSTVLQRVALSMGIQALLAADVRKQWGDLKRMTASGAPQEDIEAHEDRLVEHVNLRCKAIRQDMQRGRYGLDALPAEDQALYFLGSALATLQRTILIQYALPTLPSLLPINRYNTHSRTWTDYYEQEHAAISEPGASNGGGVGSGGHVSREQIMGPIRRIVQTWALEEQDIERHNEFRGREGAPEWDLMTRTMDVNSALVLIDKARLVAFGSNPQDGVQPFTPGSMVIPGFLYTVAATAVDFNTNSGDTNYENLKEWIRLQRVAGMWTEGLAANVLTLSPSSYFNLKGQFLNANKDMNVIDALLQNVAGLDRIDVAREYEVIPGELKHLQDLGHPLASYYAGGIRDFGTDTQREAISLHRDDPEIVAQQEGHDLEMSDSALNNGLFAGTIAAATGGARAAQPAGLALGFQAA